MELNLKSLTAFNNRYYRSTTGQQSAQWIFNRLTGIAAGKSGVTVTKFAHTWVQFSVIARIAGTTSGPVAILGCHQDSINLSDPFNGRAPGADDVRFVSRS
jgi:leucyl aminopeptidase